MRFHRLSLTNWRNFKSLDVEIQNRCFIIGPNASGKSNLVDAFRFLRDLAADGLFDAVVKRRGGVSKLRSLHARQLSGITIEADIEDASEQVWRYRLSFSASKEHKDKRPVVLEETIQKKLEDGKWDRVAGRKKSEDDRDPELLTQTYLEQVSRNKDFRPMWDALRTVSYLHLVPQMLKHPQDDGAKLGTERDLYGRDILAVIASVAKKTRDGRLRRISDCLDKIVPQLKGLELVKDHAGHPHLQARFAHWRSRGAYQEEGQFSDGTLRLIGMLWSLQEPGGPLLLEEPELYLHPAVVSRLAPFIHKAQRAAKRRQVILTTHSSDLLDDPGIGSAEIIVLAPTDDGTIVSSGMTHPEIRQMMELGISAGEAALPMTVPNTIDQFVESKLS